MDQSHYNPLKKNRVRPAQLLAWMSAFGAYLGVVAAYNTAFPTEAELALRQSTSEDLIPSNNPTANAVMARARLHAFENNIPMTYIKSRNNQ